MPFRRLITLKNYFIMARRKMERIPELDAAEARLASLKSIDPNLDLGDGRSIKTFSDSITAARNGVSDYNQLLSTVDNQYNAVLKLIKETKTLSKNMLSGVGSRWTTDSSQYEQAGGTRDSERKKTVRKPKDPGEDQ